MKNLNGVTEIVAYLTELFNKPNGKYELARIYGMAMRQEEKREKENQIADLLNLSTGERVDEVSFVGDGVAIAKVESNRKESTATYYHPVVNGKRCFEVADTFDRALAIALGEKYGVRSYAPQAIVSLLRIDEYEAKSSHPKSFMDMVADGESSLEHIDDAIEQWHRGGAGDGLELHEFLGLTHYEYQEGVMHNKKEVLENIVELRKRFKK